jgi:hypothetical protein
MAEKKPEPVPDVKVAYFRTNPNVTKEIEDWARRSGARILSIVPVYWEDVAHG